MQAATDGIWQRKLLFVASPSAIHAVFVAADREKASPFIEVCFYFHTLVPGADFLHT